MLHACIVEDESFVGMGATILDGAVVEKGAMVAAGALVTQKTRIPSGQVCFTFLCCPANADEVTGRGGSLSLP